MSDAPFFVNFRKTKAVKVICLLTAFVFLFNTLAQDVGLLRPLGFVGQAWAAKTPPELTSVGSGDAGSHLKKSGGGAKELNVSAFILPPELGTVKDSWASGDKVVIHIQDAHCNYAAQRKIADIISYLNANYEINLINLEGGAEGYDLTPFTGIKDVALRERACDYFVKAGLVNGAEYFAVNNPEKAKLWGVEDVNLYIDNLKVYRGSLAYKAEAENLLKAVSLTLSSLKPKIYSKELFDIDMNYTSYKAGNLPFKDYLKFLLSRTTYEVNNAIDGKTPRRLSFKNIELLGKVLEAEAGIDFRRADNEKTVMIDELQRRIPRVALEEIVAKTIDFKEERISPVDFYGYIQTKAETVSMDMGDYPDLVKYISYVTL